MVHRAESAAFELHSDHADLKQLDEEEIIYQLCVYMCVCMCMCVGQ